MYNLIKSIKEDSPECKVYIYSIEYEGKPKGDAALFIQKFDTLHGHVPSMQIVKWQRLGLKKDDNFCCLDDFYPNGRDEDDEQDNKYQNNGAEILNEIFLDIAKDAPKMIFTIPKTKGIKDFLTSQGWTSDYKSKRLMYRIIK